MKLLKYYTLITVSLAVTACGQPNSPYSAYGYQQQPYGYQQQPYGYQQQPYGYQQQPYGYQQTYSAPRQANNLYSANTSSPALVAKQPTATNQTAAASKLQPAAASTNAAKMVAANPQTVTAAPKAITTQAAAAPSQGEQFLAKMKQAFDQLQSLSATVETFEKSGAQTGQGKVNMIFKKPGSVKIDILESTQSGQKGSKLSFQSGGQQIKARGSGVLGIVAVTLAANDSKVVSGRKYQVTQIDLASTILRLTKPGAQVKAIGKTQMNGKNVVILEFTGQEHFDPRITRERIAIDMETNLIASHEMYEGDQMVYATKILQITLNPPLTADAFNV